MKYPYKEDWWETKDHKKIKISDMKISHIENTIKFLQRHDDFYDEEYEFYDYDNGEMFYDYSDNSYLVDKKITELQYELDKKRKNKNMNKKEIIEFVPIDGKLYISLENANKSIDIMQKRIEKQKEVIDKAIEYIRIYRSYQKIDNKDYLKGRDEIGCLDIYQVDELLDLLNEVSE